MPKLQKKIAALNVKTQGTRKPKKSTEETSVRHQKPANAQPKTTKKLAVSPEKSTRDSKQSRLLTLLRCPTGATVEEMAAATGWQRHSVHGLMSGVLKKRLGLSIASAVEKRGRVYHIASGR